MWANIVKQNVPQEAPKPVVTKQVEEVDTQTALKKRYTEIYNKMMNDKSLLPRAGKNL